MKPSLKNLPSAETMANVLGATPQQVRAQLDRNAVQLAGMAKEAMRSGRPVNGYTGNELVGMAAGTAARASRKRLPVMFRPAVEFTADLNLNTR